MSPRPVEAATTERPEAVAEPLGGDPAGHGDRSVLEVRLHLVERHRVDGRKTRVLLAHRELQRREIEHTERLGVEDVGEQVRVAYVELTARDAGLEHVDDMGEGRRHTASE